MVRWFELILFFREGWFWLRPDFSCIQFRFDHRFAILLKFPPNSSNSRIVSPEIGT